MSDLLDASRGQLVAPEPGVGGLGLRQLQEQILAHGVRFSLSESRVQRRPIQLVPQVVLKAFDIIGHFTPRPATHGQLRGGFYRERVSGQRLR